VPSSFTRKRSAALAESLTTKPLPAAGATVTSAAGNAFDNNAAIEPAAMASPDNLNSLRIPILLSS
jgi:hypothetical protein